MTPEIAAEAGRTDVAEHDTVFQEEFSLANELTDEMMSADHIVIATPMHNWGPPSALKAWFDRIINYRTFYSRKEQLTDTQITLIISSGGPYSIVDTLKSQDFLRPWISFVLQKIGAQEKNIKFVNCDPTGRDVTAAWERARSMIPDAVEREHRSNEL